MTKTNLLVSFDAAPDQRALFAEMLGDKAELTYLPDLPEAARNPAIAAAEVFLGFSFRRDLGAEGMKHIGNLKLVQMMTAGVDQLPFADIPDGLAVANNAGAWAAPMAEHVVAMTLCAAKRLFVEHAEMQAGNFNQFRASSIEMSGAVCGVIGYGGIGRESARLLRCLGVEIHAINRSGKTDDDVAFIGTLDDLETVLRAADIVLLSIARTQITDGMIGARELGWMKDEAILVNVARGELVDETALYQHMKAHPRFFACIDSWWVEPARHGEFRLQHPFFDLPNLVGSPHNSASTPGAYLGSARRAAENIRRYLDGETPHYLVREDERLA